MLTVLLGGARSGKSTLAVELGVAATGAGREVVFVATCPRIDGDADLERRIADHRAERPPGWTTIEEQVELAGAIAAASDGATVIVDCLTLWVANLQLRGDDPDAIADAGSAAIDAATGRTGDVIVVSNEVGLGIVPADSTTREYRDVLGRVNREWAARADRALFLVAGRAFPLHDPRGLLR